MGKKLYVGNLSYTSNDESLAQEFSKFGTVDSAKVITDKMTGRSKGFGFVEMSTEDEAMQAIEQMNGVEFGGRTITVNEARPQAPRENRSFGGGGGGNRDRGFGGGGGGNRGNRY
jgi:RNA recognition motif-containing protein